MGLLSPVMLIFCGFCGGSAGSVPVVIAEARIDDACTVSKEPSSWLRAGLAAGVAGGVAIQVQQRHRHLRTGWNVEASTHITPIGLLAFPHRHPWAIMICAAVIAIGLFVRIRLPHRCACLCELLLHESDLEHHGVNARRPEFVRDAVAPQTLQAVLNEIQSKDFRAVATCLAQIVQHGRPSRFCVCLQILLCGRIASRRGVSGASRCGAFIPLFALARSVDHRTAKRFLANVLDAMGKSARPAAVAKHVVTDAVRKQIHHAAGA